MDDANSRPAVAAAAAARAAVTTTPECEFYPPWRCGKQCGMSHTVCHRAPGEGGIKFDLTLRYLVAFAILAG